MVKAAKILLVAVASLGLSNCDDKEPPVPQKTVSKPWLDESERPGAKVTRAVLDPNITLEKATGKLRNTQSGRGFGIQNSNAIDRLYLAQTTENRTNTLYSFELRFSNSILPNGSRRVVYEVFLAMRGPPVLGDKVVREQKQEDGKTIGLQELANFLRAELAASSPNGETKSEVVVVDRRGQDIGRLNA